MKQYFQFWKGRVWLNIIAGHWQTSFITGRKLINVNKNTKTDIKLFFIFNYPSKITSEISSPTNKTFLNLFWWYLKQIYLHIPINWINFQLISSNDVSSFFIFLYIILIKNIQYHKLWQIIQEIKWIEFHAYIDGYIERIPYDRDHNLETQRPTLLPFEGLAMGISGCGFSWNGSKASRGRPQIYA